jgi:hypothetical protein
MTAAFDDAGVSAVVVGGVAVSLLGRPRFTRDIDALVDLDEARWPDLVEAAHRARIVPRIEGALPFARRSRVLLLRHTPSQIDIDVILGGLPFERATVAAAQPRSVGDLTVRLPRVEDLMIMKACPARGIRPPRRSPGPLRAAPCNRDQMSIPRMPIVLACPP